MATVEPAYPPLLAALKDPLYRLNNLYWIQDAKGNRVRFRCNAAQLEFCQNQHTCNLVLKARQLGFTTLFCLQELDACIFYSNSSIGIIAQTREDAEDIFQRKIKYPWDNLNPAIKEQFNVDANSARELRWSNGSSIRVATSLRGSTLTHLHVMEMGKICAKFPQRAREIMTGSLNTVHAGQKINIESTAEGSDGEYYQLCKAAQDQQLAKRPLTPLDFRFHFFAWWKNPEYQLESVVPLTQDDQLYFHNLKAKGIELTQKQKWWYVKKKQTQREDMLREFPSTPDEAFASSGEGRFFAKDFEEMRRRGQIGSVLFDKNKMVITGWDLGVNDLNCIWFAQLHGPYIKLIDYLEASDKSIASYAKALDEKAKELGYRYEIHFLPHDADQRQQIHPLLWSRAQVLSQDHGFQVQVTPRIKREIDGVVLTRDHLGNIYIDEQRCSKGLKAVENYRKVWNNTLGHYEDDKPMHNWASHGQKALETLLLGITHKLNKSNLLTLDDIASINNISSF